MIGKIWPQFRQSIPRWLMAPLVAQFAVMSVTTLASAQWTTNGVLVCPEPGYQASPAIVSDDAGGAIVVWTDYRAGNRDIYAQRLDADGIPQWASEGIVVCTAPGDQQHPVIVSDGTGGAIIAWLDGRSGGLHVYAQRIDVSGVPQWASDGIAVCTTGVSFQPLNVISDGAGGAIFSWQGSSDIFAQRITSMGSTAWTLDGVLLCSSGSPKENPAMAPDGAGGAIVAWSDWRSGDRYEADIYAQRVSATGALQWNSEGVSMCAAPRRQNYPGVISDGAGGAIVAWKEYRRSSPYIVYKDVYAQRVSGAGATLWTTNGVPVDIGSAAETYSVGESPISGVPDGAGGAILAWEVYDAFFVGWKVRRQRISSSGSWLWSSGTLPGSGQQHSARLCEDGSGGAVFTYVRAGGYQAGGPTYWNIYAQRLNSFGAAQWGGSGLALCTAEEAQRSPVITCTATNGALVAWADERPSSDGDVYAQRAVGLPVLGEPNASTFWLTSEPAQLTVTWTNVDPVVDQVTILYSADGFASSQVLASSVAASAGGWSGSWVLAPADTTGARVRLACYTAGGSFVGLAESGGFAVGNRGAIRLDVQRFNQSAFSAPVLFWDQVPSATSYEVEVSSDALTACKPGSWARYVSGKSWTQIDAGAWANLPAARYIVTVTPYAGATPLPPFEAMQFVRFKLSDLDPYDTENKPPILLVHGWISSQSTWFVCGDSPLQDGLINGPPGERFHPWAFEYPNIGPITHSAAGLDSAAHYVANRAGTTSVGAVAHSMGGLVARTMLQGFAVDPALDPDGSYPFRTPSVSVSHLATLSTPHLGEPPEAVLIAAHRHSTGEVLGLPGRYLSITCSGCEQSASALNLRSDSPLLLRLNSNPLPPANYLFAGGIDHIGEALGAYRGHRLEELSGCDLGADGTVDVCSARAQCGEPTDERLRPTFAQGAIVVRAHYNLSHGRISRPGAVFDPPGNCQSPQSEWNEYDDLHQSESTYLFNDVIGFLRCGDCLPTSTCPNPDRKEFRQRLVALDTEAHAARTLSSNQATESAPTLPLRGARVRLFELDSVDSLAGFIAYSDGSGEVSFTVPPGKYGVEFRSSGSVARTDTVIIPSTSTALARTTSLAASPSYAGPREPTLLINAGELVTSDSTVVLSPSCVDATQVQLSESPDFVEASWQPLVEQVPFTLSAGPGMKAVYARFRDDVLRESDPISALIHIVGTPAGALDVSVGGANGEVIVDGAATGKTTPASIVVGEGTHQVSIRAPGWMLSPAAASVAVRSGESTPIGFSANAAPVPSDAVWTLPENDTTLGRGSDLSWRSESPTSPTDIVFFDCLISRDSTFTSIDAAHMGVPDTTLRIPESLGDSLRYFASIRAISGFSVGQSGPSRVIRFQTDWTAPNVSIQFPTAGSILMADSLYVIRLLSDDWSGSSSLTVLLSRDGGTTYPDTIYAGAYADTVVWTASAPPSNSCRMRGEVGDDAGNVGIALSDSLFVIQQSVTAVEIAEWRVPRLTILPNPAHGVFRVNLLLPNPTTASVRCYDVVGRQVALLAEGEFPAGLHAFELPSPSGGTHRLPSGIYFVRVELPGQSLSGRVVLMR